LREEASGRKSKLAEKMSLFSDFPQFWEEEEDLDPILKAEQDREVEAFRLRLEAPSAHCARKRFSDNSSFGALTELCNFELCKKQNLKKQRYKNGREQNNTAVYSKRV